MLNLSPEEAQWLRQMADDLATSTQDRTYWLSNIRETSLTILAQVAEWLGDACGQQPTDTPLSDRHPCVRPAHHTGPHMSPLGHSWPNPTPT